MGAAKKQPLVEVISIDDGLSDLQVAHSAPDEQIYALLCELRAEPVIHSWKLLSRHGEKNIGSYLYEYENKKRPTDFFFYLKDSPGDPELVAIGTVAHKIDKTFPHVGFPVIARCFVREKFRNQRLYFPILKHRFKYCQNFYGDKLRAIHLGSQNPRVFSVIKKNIFGIPLVYVGDEYLEQEAGQELVRDYIWFSNRMREEIQALRKSIVTSHPEFGKLNNLLTKLFDNAFDDTDYFNVLQAVQKIEKDLNWSPKSNLAFQQFMDLMQAIGVIAKEKSDLSEPLPIAKRKV